MNSIETHRQRRRSWQQVLASTFRNVINFAMSGGGCGSTVQCQMVSNIHGGSCCSGGCTGACGDGGSDSDITRGLNNIDSHRFTMFNGHPQEGALQAELSAGRPVARVMSMS